MTMSASKTSDLEQRAARWRAALAAGASGPLLIADDVRQLAEQWQAFREEADGIDCTTWLRGTLGRSWNLHRFLVLSDALTRTGSLGKRLHHETVRWLVGKIADDVTLRRCVKVLFDEGRLNNGGNPVSVQAARRVLTEEIGHTASPRKMCARCERIREWARALELELPE